MWTAIVTAIDTASDLMFWSITILLIAGMWFGCDWLATWLEDRKHDQVVARKREAEIGRALREQVRRDLRERVARRVAERGDPPAFLRTPSRPMWIADPADRQQASGVNGDAA